MSDVQKKIQACFVNSEELPTRISEPLAFLVEEINNDEKKELVLHSIREKTYPHPDAPDVARAIVLDYQVEKRAKYGDRDYAAIYLLLQAQNNLKR